MANINITGGGQQGVQVVDSQGRASAVLPAADLEIVGYDDVTSQPAVVTLEAGSNITLSQTGTAITVASTAAGSSSALGQNPSPVQLITSTLSSDVVVSTAYVGTAATYGAVTPVTSMSITPTATTDDYITIKIVANYGTTLTSGSIGLWVGVYDSNLSTAVPITQVQDIKYAGISVNGGFAQISLTFVLQPATTTTQTFYVGATLVSGVTNTMTIYSSDSGNLFSGKNASLFILGEDIANRAGCVALSTFSLTSNVSATSNSSARPSWSTSIQNTVGIFPFTKQYTNSTLIIFGQIQYTATSLPSSPFGVVFITSGPINLTTTCDYCFAGGTIAYGSSRIINLPFSFEIAPEYGLQSGEATLALSINMTGTFFAGATQVYIKEVISDASGGLVWFAASDSPTSPLNISAPAFSSFSPPLSSTFSAGGGFSTNPRSTGAVELVSSLILPQSTTAAFAMFVYDEADTSAPVYTFCYMGYYGTLVAEMLVTGLVYGETKNFIFGFTSLTASAVTFFVGVNSSYAPTGVWATIQSQYYITGASTGTSITSVTADAPLLASTTSGAVTLSQNTASSTSAGNVYLPSAPSISNFPVLNASGTWASGSMAPVGPAWNCSILGASTASTWSTVSTVYTPNVVFNMATSQWQVGSFLGSALITNPAYSGTNTDVAFLCLQPANISNIKNVGFRVIINSYLINAGLTPSSGFAATATFTDTPLVTGIVPLTFTLSQWLPTVVSSANICANPVSGGPPQISYALTTSPPASGFTAGSTVLVFYASFILGVTAQVAIDTSVEVF